MIRQFRFRVLNETLPDFRTWPNLFLDMFRDSPLARLFQRPDPFDPADILSAAAGKPEQPDSIPADRVGPMESPGDRPVESPGDRPIDSPGDRPVAAAGPFGPLLPGTAIAVMDAQATLRLFEAPPLSRIAEAGRYQVFYLNGFEQSIVVDTARMEIVPDRADAPQLGGGSSDMLVIAGPLDAPAVLPTSLRGLESLVLQDGASYDLTALDDHVGRGARLTVDALSLGAANSARFDGSGEQDGEFLFFGGGGDDTFLGGAGDDRILGGDGADTLRGNGGADRYVYHRASESSGAGHDVLLDLNPAEDRIDLPVTVSGFDAAVRAGSLSNASFDGDLAAALAGLGAGRAVLFAPTAGDLAGNVFLVVDGNGQAGYQAGEDFVFALPGANVDNLGASAAIFI
jgi:hypothetical protein